MIKKIIKIFTSRLFFTFFFIILQGALVYLSFVFWQQSMPYSISSYVLGLIMAIVVFSRDDSTEYMLNWIFLILVFPVFGSLMYAIFGDMKHSRMQKKYISGYSEIISSINSSVTMPPCDCLDPSDSILTSRLSSFVALSSKALPYRAEYVSYIADNNSSAEIIAAELSKARKFIFMEYFILDKGSFYDKIFEVLRRKVSEGVEVYFLYDDMGSINTLPYCFWKEIEKEGIKAMAFNTVKPRLRSQTNYRDHRKMCIIDGSTVISGGINIADEYINLKERFGHWKDNLFIIRGKAVCSYTVMFMSMWNFSVEESRRIKDYNRYIPCDLQSGVELVQSFGDCPLDNVNTAESVFIQMISNARKYIWISTPYLILDSVMKNALILAARSGVDVRIITPGIPDKKIVYALTQSNYNVLTNAGVKIFEYTPGFIHSKMCVSDDDCALVGTSNMDYRSFYLHFECGTIFYGKKTIESVKKDFESTFNECREVSPDFGKKTGVFRKVFLIAAKEIATML